MIERLEYRSAIPLVRRDQPVVLLVPSYCSLLAAMKGMTWESPRGPVTIDPQTRDVVNNIYIRKVEKINGQLYDPELQPWGGSRTP